MYIVLLILWIAFNGKFTWEIFLLGAVLCGFIFMFCVKYLGYNVKTEIRLIKKLPLMFEYVLILIKEIFVANITVLKIMVSRKKVNPILYSFTADIKSSGARVILSHSITLTPGTITVELVDNIFVVHCLDEAMAEGMKDSKFIDILKRIEKGI